MIINHNLQANNALRNMSINSNNSSKAMEKLSSGLRINRAGDDAAGLAISEKMRGQINGLNQASSNAQDAISLVQTAEGALNETHSILQRMRTLAVQASNDTATNSDRSNIQDEVNQLTSEIDRIATTTQFNTKNLLDGSFSGKFQIGANANQDMSLSIGQLDTSALGLTSSITIEEGSVATASTLKDGTYKISGGSVFDANQNNVGIASTNNKIYVGTTAILSGTKDKFEAGSLITISNSGANFSVKGAIDSTASKLAAGSYETLGSNLVKDGKIVGSLSGNVVLLDQADGSTVAISGGNLGISTTAVTSGQTFTINGVDVSTRDEASGSITSIQNAIDSVSKERSKLGAVQNRLEHTINNLGVSSENLTSAESRIRDVDMASEMSEYSKNNILSQAAQAMLAQANQQPQQVLQLLR
ncbi:flagellin [Clostridium kluyveri]|uniref:flagellin N-terminal helical domain-containing protein n=1 Tax=Clostridium kluyveri TaxID=1534 RepID=UPI002247FA2C|nr:flagellin [Clostridium kluyveri]UZQ50519.1 flagellin [Clostridium kluyveri]